MQGHENIALFIERFNAIGIKYMIAGSVASIFYGEPRMTHDIDLVLEVSSSEISKIANEFPPEEFYCPPLDVMIIESRRELRGHFNIIHHDSGFKADIYFTGREPLQFWGIKNRRKVSITNQTYWFASPEYVILKKLEYYKEGQSEKHIRDSKAIMEMTVVDIAELQNKAQLLGVTEQLNLIM